MPKSKRLIVGLGNPGPEYEETRHNIGFMVADAVAERARITLEHDRGDVLLGWGRIRSFPVGVAKPLVYMNRSGQSVRTLLQRNNLQTQEMLIVVDDINLPPGKLRLRPNGSAGGHNGVQDIIDKLNSANFPRLRIGIGSSFPRGGQVEYVLAPFEEEERAVIEGAVEEAAEAALVFVREGLVPAMNRYNRK